MNGQWKLPLLWKTHFEYSPGMTILMTCLSLTLCVMFGMSWHVASAFTCPDVHDTAYFDMLSRSVVYRAVSWLFLAFPNVAWCFLTSHDVLWGIIACCSVSGCVVLVWRCRPIDHRTPTSLFFLCVFFASRWWKHHWGNPSSQRGAHRGAPLLLFGACPCGGWVHLVNIGLILCSVDLILVYVIIFLWSMCRCIN